MLYVSHGQWYPDIGAIHFCTVVWPAMRNTVHFKRGIGIELGIFVAELFTGEGETGIPNNPGPVKSCGSGTKTANAFVFAYVLHSTLEYSHS